MCDLAFYLWCLERPRDACDVAAYPAQRVPFPDHYSGLWTAPGVCICTHYLLLSDIGRSERIPPLILPVHVLPRSLPETPALINKQLESLAAVLSSLRATKVRTAEERTRVVGVLRDVVVRLALKRSGAPGKEFYPEAKLQSLLDDALRLLARKIRA
jgi:hypothetical protein